MNYRELQLEEAELIATIDATWFIKNAWKLIEGKLQLVEINWTEQELPNGLSWHLEHFRKNISKGGKAYGCFQGEELVGYATINAEPFGKKQQYVLLDQLFISHDYRARGIGRRLVELCKQQAKSFGADKIYICSAYAEDTVAFYRKIGCKDALEVNEELAAADPNDLQLELILD